MVQLRTEMVWTVMEKQLFAVLGMVTNAGEARTVGITYIIDGRKLYITSQKDAWKVRHIAHNSHVSLTIPIGKRIPLLPFIKIPSATITFSAEATVLAPEEASDSVRKRLFRNKVDDALLLAETSVIEVTPQKEFLTYGIGVPIWQMADREKARGRVRVT